MFDAFKDRGESLIMNKASSQRHIFDRVPLKSVVKTLTQPERCAEGGRLSPPEKHRGFDQLGRGGRS